MTETAENKVLKAAPAGGAMCPRRSGLSRFVLLLRRDSFALGAFVVLVVVIGLAVFGAPALEQQASGINLRARNSAPFSLDKGFLYVLGADILGRSIVARLIVASRTTLAITFSAVTFSLCAGTSLGLLAGYYSGWTGTVIMRITDTVMSFPSLLMAVIVLYMLEPNAFNVVLVLAITRMPVYIRVTRAEVLEIRERTFVEAAQAAGASDMRLLLVHILPVVLPTLLTVATLDFANVMLNESALSFLGIGVQPPDVTWGLMVAEGRNYLGSAWWLAAFPGLAIMFTTLAANLLSNWMRFVTDPILRTRLESRSP
jgi:peptide/nickel transport system permease protein